MSATGLAPTAVAEPPLEMGSESPTGGLRTKVAAAPPRTRKTAPERVNVSRTTSIGAAARCALRRLA
jgi:hypothetical protein